MSYISNPSNSQKLPSSNTRKLIFTVTNDLSYDQRMLRICTSLAKAGFSVTLVGRQLPTSQPLLEQLFAQKRLNCYFHKGKLFYIAYNIRLFFYLLRQPANALCAIDLDTILPIYTAARWKNIPFAYDAHEYFSETPEVERRPFTKKIWETIANFAIPKATLCYTVSQSLCIIFEEKYGKKFGLIRNTPFYSIHNQLISDKKTNQPIILYQGALNEGRGLEVLLAAMQHIENAQLWLAGEGDISDILRKMVLQNNLKEKVVFLGFVPPVELKKLTAQATIGVNLLENRSLSYYYSLANKTFDYIQAAVPSLQMDFPEYRNLNAEFETSILIPALSPDAIAAALQKLLNDPTYYNRLKTNCMAARPVFCWEKEEIRLVDAYKTLFLK
jgi:glycosyltransferase involved in cell wall biosynthesis